MGKHSKNLVRGTSYVFVAMLLGSMLAYGSRILLARALDPSDFGLFFGVYNIMILVGWIKNFGVGSALSKFVPELAAKKDNGGLRFILTLTIIFTSVTTIIALLLAMAIPPSVLSNYFQSNLARSLVILFFGFLFVDNISRIISGYFLATHRYPIYSLREFLFNLSVVLLLLFTADISLVMVVYFFIAASVLTLGVNVIFAQRYFPKGAPLKFRVDIVRDVAKYSFPLVMRDVFDIIMRRVDNLFLIYFRPLMEVGMYNVVDPTADILVYIARPFSRVIFPLSSEMYSTGKKEKLTYLLGKIHKFIFILFVPASCFLFFWADNIVAVVFGKNFLAASLGLKILVIGVVFRLFNTVYYPVLLGIGLPGRATLATISGNVSNVILNLLLIPFFGQFDKGFIGAIIATIISSGVLFVWLLVLLRTHLDFRFPIKETFLVALIGGCLYYASHLIQVRFVNVWHEVFVFAILAGTFYPLILLLFNVVNRKEIKSVVSLIKK